MGIKAPKVNDVFQTKEFAVTMTLRNSTDTANSTDGIFVNLNASGATITNNNTNSITIEGLESQVNNAIQNTNFRPGADIGGNFNVAWSQSDDNGTGTPGSNPLTGLLPMDIRNTHAEFSIGATQIYYDNTLETWNLGSITDERPTNIDPNIIYTITLQNVQGFLTGWIGDYESLDQGDTCAISGDGSTLFAGESIYVNTSGIWVEEANIGALMPANADIVDSVSLSNDGDTLAVGDWTYNDVEPTVLTGTVDTSGTAVTGTGTLFQSELAVNDYISVSGELRQVATITDDENLTVDSAFSTFTSEAITKTTPETGIVVVFKRTGTSWSLEQSFQDGGGIPYTNFGYSIDLADDDGNTVIVGALESGDGSIYDDTGSAYVWTRSGSTWSHEDKLKPTLNDDAFGYDVAISGNGNTAVITSPEEDTFGKAWVYTRSGSVWTEATSLSPNTEANAQYGQSVAIDGLGQRIVVGTHFKDNGPTSDTGAYYYHTGSGASWSAGTVVYDPNGEQDDRFGESVDISYDGTTILIGVPGLTPGATAHGGLMVFDTSGTLQEIIQPSNLQSGDRLGLAVSIDSDGSTYVGCSERETWVGEINTTQTANEFTFTGTRTQCNNRLATTNFRPFANYSDNFVMTYLQNQDTDSVNQGSTTITVENKTSQAIYTSTSPGPVTANSYTAYDAGSISDIEDPTGNVKNYTLSLRHEYVTADVNGYNNISQGGITGVWTPGTQTLSFTGTINQINNNINDFEINMDAGTTAVYATLVDNTVGVTTVNDDLRYNVVAV